MNWLSRGGRIYNNFRLSDTLDISLTDLLMSSCEHVLDSKMNSSYIALLNNVLQLRGDAGLRFTEAFMTRTFLHFIAALCVYFLLQYVSCVSLAITVL